MFKAFRAFAVTAAVLLAVAASPARKPRPPADTDAVHLVDIPTAAARLSVDPKTVKRMVASGELFSVKLRNRRLIPSYAVDEYIRRLVAEAENRTA